MYSKVSNKRICTIRIFFITDKNSPFFSCAAKIISIDFFEKYGSYMSVYSILWSTTYLISRMFEFDAGTVSHDDKSM